METKSIAWNTGNGNITLTYQGHGNGTITVESDQNDLATARSQTIVVKTTNNAIIKNLTITQTACPIPVGTVKNYDYTGTVQSVLLPAGTYKLQCWGAQGGSVSGSYTATGAKGGYSEGTLTLSSPTTVYIFVGGKGSDASTSTTGGVQNGGWNGGGGAPRVSQYNSDGENGISYPRPGGGASDISLVDSTMDYSNYQTNRSEASLLARLIVAGGGAGASVRYTSTTTTTNVTGTKVTSYHISTEEWATLSPYQSIDNTLVSGAGVVRTGEFSNGRVDIYAVTAGSSYIFNAYYPQYNNYYAINWFTSNGTFIKHEPYVGSSSQNTAFTNQSITAPSNAAYLYFNVVKAYSSSFYIQQYTGRIRRMAYSGLSYYDFPVTAGETYDVTVPSWGGSQFSTYKPIKFGSGFDSDNYVNNASIYSSYVAGSSFSGSITVPSNATHIYIVVASSVSALPTVSYTTTTTSSGTSNGTQVGGGTSGGGTNPGTQSGGGGELGKGANMTQTGYRYCSGGGGGGYYGGGSSYDDSTTNKINQSGGGSGYIGSLSNAQTKAGNTSFPNTSGSGNETGHNGDGYAKITRLS